MCCIPSGWLFTPSLEANKERVGRLFTPSLEANKERVECLTVSIASYLDQAPSREFPGYTHFNLIKPGSLWLLTPRNDLCPDVSDSHVKLRRIPKTRGRQNQVHLVRFITQLD